MLHAAAADRNFGGIVHGKIRPHTAASRVDDLDDDAPGGRVASALAVDHLAVGICEVCVSALNLVAAPAQLVRRAQLYGSRTLLYPCACASRYRCGMQTKTPVKARNYADEACSCGRICNAYPQLEV